MKIVFIILVFILGHISSFSQSKAEQERFFRDLVKNGKDEEKKVTFTPNISLDYRQEDGFGGEVSYSISTPRTLFNSQIYISTKLSMRCAIDGYHYSRGRNSRLEYSIIGYKDNRYYWGIGYDNGLIDSKSLYTELGVKANIGYKFYVTKNLNITPVINYEFFKTRNLFTDDASNHIHIGLDAKYDSRDNKTDPNRGVLLSFLQKVYPAFLFKQQAFFQTSIIADVFIPVWKKGIIAIDLFYESNYGESPWYLWTPIGGNSRMRGYYYGRYRDKNSLIAQIELRQNIYKSHGIAAWCGAGYIFPSIQEFSIKDILPNFGIGYRYKTSAGLIRIDVGIGKGGEWGIITGINHAF